MSSAEIAARTIKLLQPEDFEVLSAMEKSIPSFESVPLHRIERLTDLHRDQVLFRLGRLNQFGFVIGNQFGYFLLTAGLDVLALNSFVKQGLVSGMGKSVGMGKESDVFEVINDSGENSVIKFYRIGRTSFRTTRKSRSYVDPKYQHQWLTVNIHAALKEAQGLVKAEAAGVSTPHFIARNRHAVLMEEVDGIMLHHCTREDIRNPKSLLKQILENVKLSFGKAGLINGDLSEYNILFDGAKPWIIDWPQYVTTSHRNAFEILVKDVQNLTSFFRKKFKLESGDKKAIAFVQGKLKSLKL